MQRRMTAGSSLAETTTHRQARILRAQIHQAGKAAHAGHEQIEQDQIDLAAAAFEEFGDLLEGAGLGDIGAAEHAVDRLAQRAAEQRMVVGDQQVMEIVLRSTGNRREIPWSFMLLPIAKRGPLREQFPLIPAQAGIRFSGRSPWRGRADSSSPGAASHKLQNHLAPVRLRPMLGDINALPGAERHLARRSPARAATRR